MTTAARTPETPLDRRYVYGAGCSWHGTISEAGKTAPGPHGHLLPCCPYCGGMLFELPTGAEWWDGARAHDQRGHTNYVDFLEWTRKQKRCWPSLRMASRDYQAATGKEVKWDL